MNRIIGTILLIGAVALVYFGITTFQESTASAKILGVELSATDEGGQTTGIIYLALGVVVFFGGLFMLSRKSR